MKLSHKITGIILALVLALGVGALAIPALAKGGHQAAAIQGMDYEGQAAAFPGLGSLMQFLGRLGVTGNVKTVAPGSLTVTTLNGKDVTLQTNDSTQYRYAPGISGVSVGNFVSVLARRGQNANRVAWMVIVHSQNPVYFVNGKVTAIAANSFTVKSGNKEYLITGDANTKYQVVTLPVRAPGRHLGQMNPNPRKQGDSGGKQGQTPRGQQQSAFRTGDEYQIELVADASQPAAGQNVQTGTFSDVQVGRQVSVRATGSPTSLLATEVTIFVRPTPPPTPTLTPGSAATGTTGASYRYSY